MPKTSSRSDSVIKVLLKKDLKAELAKLVTTDELKKEITGLATRKDLETTEKSLQIDTKLALLSMERRLENKIAQSRDLLITTFDPLLKGLEQRQEDRELASYQSEQASNRLDDHEKRIEILEQSA